METTTSPSVPAPATARSRLARRLSGAPSIVFDAVGLLVCFTVVYLIYAVFVDPTAEEVLRLADETNSVPGRSIAIVIKDWEQQTCIVLGLWCLWLFVSRYRLLSSEQYLFDMDFLGLGEIEEFSDGSLRRLQDGLDAARAEIPDSLLIRSVREAIDQVRMNGDFRAASEAAQEVCELHLEVLNSKLAATKYILWAIPSIGFLGTVRGIGEALGLAGEAVAGDISGVAGSLGTAFNSTWVALFVNLVLMLLSSFLHGREEALVANCKAFATQTLARLNGLRSAARDTVEMRRSDGTLP